MPASSKSRDHLADHANSNANVRSSLIAPLTMQAMHAVQVPVYDFSLHQRAQETRRVEPADVVIIEGILVLHMESVRNLLNMKIFVDTDDDVRLARRCVLSIILTLPIVLLMAII